MRNVRGEVNPADLFTEHLPSREKVHQLMSVFVCEYRSGRAASAPMLLPDGSSGQQGSHLADADPLPTLGFYFFFPRGNCMTMTVFLTCTPSQRSTGWFPCSRRLRSSRTPRIGKPGWRLSTTGTSTRALDTGDPEYQNIYKGEVHEEHYQPQIRLGLTDMSNARSLQR